MSLPPNFAPDMGYVPVLETKRLILRPPSAADFGRWAEFYGDPDAMRFLGGVQEPSDAWRLLAMMVGAWALGVPAMFSVIEKESLSWVGRIGPWRPEGWPVNEVGWGVHPDAAGKGLAFEAAVASIDFALFVLGWDRVDHLIADNNFKSQSLARRLGSKEGEPRKMPGALAGWPVRTWGQSKEDWLARRASIDISVALDGTPIEPKAEGRAQ